MIQDRFGRLIAMGMVMMMVMVMLLLLLLLERVVVLLNTVTLRTVRTVEAGRALHSMHIHPCAYTTSAYAARRKRIGGCRFDGVKLGRIGHWGGAGRGDAEDGSAFWPPSSPHNAIDGIDIALLE